MCFMYFVLYVDPQSIVFLRRVKIQIKWYKEKCVLLFELTLATTPKKCVLVFSKLLNILLIHS